MSNTARSERRLAAIMFTDMVAYSALSHRDEALALELLGEMRALMGPLLSRFGGTEIKSLGDGFLLEFPNTVSAVEFGVGFQEAITKRNEGTPPERRFRVRVGIHLGEVEHQNGDVLGNDVNLAQRVQAEALPGEVWFTQTVFDHVRSRLGGRVRRAGRRALKNIPGYIPLYCVPVPGLVRSMTLAVGRLKPYSKAIEITGALLLCGLLVFLAGGLDRLLKPALARVVVLPFKSQPDSVEMRDFSTGLAQYLSSSLVRYGHAQGGIQVMLYDEAHLPGTTALGELLRKWHASQAITGSVQRQGDEVQIILNLVDATGLRVLDSAVVKKKSADLYQVQDDLGSQAISLLRLRLASPKDAQEGLTRVSSAYEAYLRGLGRLSRYDRLENLDGAVADFQEAIQRDAGYALAYAGLAEACWRKHEYTKVPYWKERARTNADKALELGPGLPRVHMVMGMIAAGTGNYDQALAEFRRVVELEPGNTEVLFGLAKAYEAQGRTAEAERQYKLVIERMPDFWAGYNQLGGFYIRNPNYEAAEKCFQAAMERTPDNYEVLANLGGLYYLKADIEKGAEALKRSLALRPTADAYSNLGMIRFLQGAQVEAVEMFKRAAAMDDNNWIFHGNLADASRLAKAPREQVRAEYEHAIELATRQLSINPKDAYTRALLATYYAGLGDTGAALREMHQAREQAATDVPTIFLSALVHEQSGQRDEALEELLAAARGQYSAPEILMHPDLAALRLDPRFVSVSNMVAPQIKR